MILVTPLKSLVISGLAIVAELPFLQEFYNLGLFSSRPI